MQDYAGVFGDVYMDGTFLDVGDSFRQCEATVGNLRYLLSLHTATVKVEHTKVRMRRSDLHNLVERLIARLDTGH